MFPILGSVVYVPIICLPLTVLEFVSLCPLYRLSLLQDVAMRHMSLYSRDLYRHVHRAVSGSASEVSRVLTCQLIPCPVFLMVTSLPVSPVDIGCFVSGVPKERVF